MRDGHAACGFAKTEKKSLCLDRYPAEQTAFHHDNGGPSNEPCLAKHEQVSFTKVERTEELIMGAGADTRSYRVGSFHSLLVIAILVPVGIFLLLYYWNSQQAVRPQQISIVVHPKGDHKSKIKEALEELGRSRERFAYVALVVKNRDRQVVFHPGINGNVEVFVPADKLTEREIDSARSVLRGMRSAEVLRNGVFVGFSLTAESVDSAIDSALLILEKVYECGDQYELTILKP